jgi:hypothetical protein
MESMKSCVALLCCTRSIRAPINSRRSSRVNLRNQQQQRMRMEDMQIDKAMPGMSASPEREG